MKNLIKKITPIRILKIYKKIKSIKLTNRNTKDIFTEIYQSNHWKSTESISGTGSELGQTKTLVASLGNLFKEFNIKSVLDVPCGDFSWMQKVDLSDIEYVGADIVEELIKDNVVKYKKRKNLKFITLDLIRDQLPESDIIICRDCLVHLSYEDIYHVISNIKQSSCKYLLTTSFTEYKLNFDIRTGDWRKLNFLEKPFNFPAPILVINENCTEDNGKHKDKSMVLWDVRKIG